MKLPELNSAQKEWVDSTLKSLTLEEKAAQVLLPQDRRNYTDDKWRFLLEKVPIGGLFLGKGPAEKLRQRAKIIQESSRVPVLIASDLEYGAEPGSRSC